jgi:hypothetical protein
VLFDGKLRQVHGRGWSELTSSEADGEVDEADEVDEVDEAVDEVDEAEAVDEADDEVNVEPAAEQADGDAAPTPATQAGGRPRRGRRPRPAQAGRMTSGCGHLAKVPRRVWSPRSAPSEQSGGTLP